MDNIKEIISFYLEKQKLNSADDYINLILLYWSFSFDCGMESYVISHNILKREEILKLPDLINILFNEGCIKYPDNLELKFWELYIEEQTLYSLGKNKNAIIRFLKVNNFYLPYFYLYTQFNIIKDQLYILKKDIENESFSYKKYYILSYLENLDSPPNKHK